MKTKTLITITAIVLGLASCTSPQKSEKLLVREIVTTAKGKHNVEYTYDAEKRLCKIHEEGIQETQFNYEGDKLISLVAHMLHANVRKYNLKEIIYTKFEEISTDSIKVDVYEIDSIKGTITSFDTTDRTPQSTYKYALNKEGLVISELRVKEDEDLTINRNKYDVNKNMTHSISGYMYMYPDENRIGHSQIVMRYEYDDQVNPLFNSLPTWVVPNIMLLNGGKNNLTKTIRETFEKENESPNTEILNTFKYIYNGDGTPAKMERSNGEVREYIYE